MTKKKKWGDIIIVTLAIAGLLFVNFIKQLHVNFSPENASILARELDTQRGREVFTDLYFESASSHDVEVTVTYRSESLSPKGNSEIETYERVIEAATAGLCSNFVMKQVIKNEAVQINFLFKDFSNNIIFDRTTDKESCSPY
jgi:hypothetical protein